MRENPFQPPDTVDVARPREGDVRQRGRIAYRVIVLMLLVPALFNYLEFDANAIMGSGLSPGTALLFRIINISAILGGTIALLGLGFQLLEFLSLSLRGLFARHTDRNDWQGHLYRALYRAAILAIPGSALWVIWVLGFYEAGLNFYLISWVVGVPANILGACVVLPLLYEWYRLARQPN